MKTRFIEPLEARIAPALTAASLSLGALNGDNGFTMKGAADFDEAGSSVSSAGDLNGDGFDDLIVGARFADEGGSNRGAAYVLFGSENFGIATFDLANAGGEASFTMSGVDDSDYTGQSVQAAGDINADGFDDIIVGAPFADEGGMSRGAAYVIFGHGGPWDDVIPLSTLNGTNGFKLSGVNDGDNAGSVVSGIGDVNGDSVDDIIIGAPGVDEGGNNRGAAYIVYGRADVWAPSMSLGTLNSFTGCKIVGSTNGQALGYSVAAAGDVNADGREDIIIGSPVDAGDGMSRGAAYVILGQGDNLGTTLNVTALNGTNGFKINGAQDFDRFGSSVGGGVDVNSDGYSDIIIGADASTPNDNGSAYVIFGHAGPYSATFSVGSLNGSNGFSMFGGAKNVFAGAAVSGAGDVNGDGYGDLLVGATSANGSGTAYVVYGKSGGFSTSFSLSTLTGTNGFALTGIDAGDEVGSTVGSAGDFNHDGYGDIIVGGHKADAGGSNLGSAYIVYGGPSGATATPTFSTDGKTATFTDLDGDLVTVKISKGKLTDAQFNLLQPESSDGARFLGLTLGATHKLGDLTITAKPTAAGGNGLVNLGDLDASTIDLGNVKIAGNVEHAIIGDAGNATVAAKSFTVQSLGIGAVAAHDTGGSYHLVNFNGKSGNVFVKGDIRGATLAAGALKTVTVCGSVVGDLADSSGSIQSAAIDTLKIGHDIRGGQGQLSGSIISTGKLGKIIIGGSLIGNDVNGTGTIRADNGIGSLSVGLDVRDASIYSASASIGKVTVGGSILSTVQERYTGIFAKHTIGPVMVKGDVIGAEDRPVVFIAGGPDIAGKKTDMALAGLDVKGSVVNARLLAGYASNGVAIDGHAQVGKIKVGGDWIASSIAAGTKTVGLLDFDHFADTDDTVIPTGNSAAVARIASILIKGQIEGTAGGTDHYGFVTREVGSLQVGAIKYKLNKGVANDLIDLGSTGDFQLREI